MVTRWRILFGCSLLPLISIAWLTQHVGLAADAWTNPAVIGSIAACILAFLSTVTRTRRRWPAALALACAAPMTMTLADEGVGDLLRFVKAVGVPAVIWLAGTFATVASACYILVAALPPIPFDRIPRARVT